MPKRVTSRLIKFICKMKKSISLFVFIAILAFINVQFFIKSTSTTTTALSYIVNTALAEGEGGSSTVPCYLTYNDPAWFVNDSYETACSPCSTVKGHNWRDVNFCIPH
jgi:hypothetical protein